ncbi:MAG: acyloxyacyl hydrolase [Rickettsiales bacterium]|nr:acyloxyacyl hydrolase [Rickettsiales bacterium]
MSAIAANSPFFGKGHENSIAIYAAQGTGGGTMFKLIQPVLWDFEPMTALMVQYSQPLKIFRLPARQSLHFVQNLSYESDRGLSFFAAGISWDVALLNWNGFYFGTGLGPYMRDSRDRRVESRLVFGEKVFIGKNINDRWRAEIFTLHFSNGNFTSVNDGFNYAGLAISCSF